MPSRNNCVAGTDETLNLDLMEWGTTRLNLKFVVVPAKNSEILEPFSVLVTVLLLNLEKHSQFWSSRTKGQNLIDASILS